MRTEIFKTVNSDAGTTKRILTFLENAENFFIGIGKSTEWTQTWGKEVSDENPPEPKSNLTEIPEPIIYKRLEKAAPALRNTACAELNLNLADSLSTTNIKDNSFSIVDPDTIYNSDGSLRVFPTYLYLSSKILYADYNATSFRTIGFYTNVKFNPNVNPNKLVYLPEEIKTSALHWVSFNTPIVRAESKEHIIQFLMKI